MSKVNFNNPKFIESYSLDDYEILTEDGFKDCIAIHKTIKFKVFEIFTKDFNLKCADEHILIDENNNQIYVKDCIVGTKIITEKGIQSIIEINIYEDLENMYDVSINSENHTFYTNGILSHNSTIYTVFALHTALFNSDRRILICANKEKTAKEFLERIKLAYEYLPGFLKLGVTNWGSTQISFENDSKITISATSPSSARGSSCDILILDEAAFIPNNLMTEFVDSVFPTISSRPDGKLIAVSTPKGMGNWFAETWHKAVYDLEISGNDNNDGDSLKWHPVRADWWDHPDRDEKWKKKQLGMLNGDSRRFAQEYGNCVSNADITVLDTITNEEKIIKIEDLLKILE